MTGLEDPRRREHLSASDAERADRIMQLAWLSLPPAHRRLLEAIGASQWQALNERLGLSVDNFFRSAGHHALSRSARIGLDHAVAVWIPDLRIVLLNTGHPALAGLDEPSYEEFVSHTAWHEWGHALGMTRCSPEDVAAGARLLDLAPEGVREGIRSGGYRVTEYTHELVAETYALLMARRHRKRLGRPSWLDDEIYSLVKRVTGWSD
ncbi:MAG: hypothetical protein ACHQDY_06505 [Solirubrobacterales bacterium]